MSGLADMMGKHQLLVTQLSALHLVEKPTTVVPLIKPFGFYQDNLLI